MINEDLGSALKQPLRPKIIQLGLDDVGKGNIQNASDVFTNTTEFKENKTKKEMIKKPLKKGISTELVGKSVMKTPIGKLFTITKEELERVQNEMKEPLEEKWTKKYKDSIDCKHPKGFSQRAHCQGKKKKSENNEQMGAAAAGGYVGPLAFDQKSDFVKRSFKETPKKVETKEATGASSAGSYVTPAAWAKSMKKKDWRGKSKTTFPGGQFVQVKKKCKTFPYCNQGDIKALNLSEQKETLKNIITKVSKKYNISESLVVDILKKELKNKNK